MTDAEYAALCANIATPGLRQAITLYSGAVLDGWHRYQACMQTGVEPRYETFEGDDVGARRFLVLVNRFRPRLSVAQQAELARRLAVLAGEQTACCRQAPAAATPVSAIAGSTCSGIERTHRCANLRFTVVSCHRHGPDPRRR